MTQDDLYLPLLGSRTAPGLARTLVGQRLEKWNLEFLSDDALLVVSELIANAVEAAPGEQLKLHLTRDRGGVLVRIWDPSPARPVSRGVRELGFAELDRADEGPGTTAGAGGCRSVRHEVAGTSLYL